MDNLIPQTDASGNPLATFTYEASGRPASVVLGNLSTGTRYYYVYNGHGDVVALTDSSGTVVASYTYDAFGVLLSTSENFPGGWSNPYRFNGAFCTLLFLSMNIYVILFHNRATETP